ncbi:MAG: PPOX class F420-dependent oxidoreductase [Candidatus Hydrothermarchaeaceae archaeon]
MSDSIPENFKDLFEKKTFASLATIMPDGTPQVSPIWIDLDGNDVIVNSAKGRQKDKNMRERPMATISIQDPQNPYRYIEVRGKVVEVTEDGAEAHIDKMAKRYLGQDTYPYRQEGEVRVLYRIKPERVVPFAM